MVRSGKWQKLLLLTEFIFSLSLSLSLSLQGHSRNKGPYTHRRGQSLSRQSKAVAAIRRQMFHIINKLVTILYLDAWHSERLNTLLTHYRRSADCFISRTSPYRAVNTFHLGYKNQSAYTVSGTSRCLFSDKYKTHKHSVGRAYSCRMLTL